MRIRVVGDPKLNSFCVSHALVGPKQTRRYNRAGRPSIVMMKMMQVLEALLDLDSQHGPAPVVWPLRDHNREVMDVLANTLVLGRKENLTLIKGLLPLRRVLNPKGCMQIVVSRRLLCLGGIDR
jgi:hypothetical protein